MSRKPEAVGLSLEGCEELSPSMGCERSYEGVSTGFVDQSV
jgi:hypothetical protein